MPSHRRPAPADPAAADGAKRTKSTARVEYENGVQVQMHKVDICWKFNMHVYFPNPAEDIEVDVGPYDFDRNLKLYLEDGEVNKEFSVGGLTDCTSGGGGGSDKGISCTLRAKVDETLGAGVAGLYPELVLRFNLEDTFFSDGGRYSSSSSGNIKLAVYLVDKHGKVLHEVGEAGGDLKIRDVGGKYDKLKIYRRLPPLQQLWNEKDKYFPDGDLRLKYQLLFRRHNPAQDLDCFPKTMGSLSHDFGKLLRDGVDTADFVINCGDAAFPVHQLVLRVRSPVFANMLAANMKEKADGKVDVEDVEPEIMKAVLEYIYSSTIQPGQYEAEQLISMALAADKYELTELKDTCLQYLVNDMQNMEATIVGQLAGLVHLVSDARIRDQVLKYCADNFSSLSETEGFTAAMRKIPTNLLQQLEFATKYKD